MISLTPILTSTMNVDLTASIFRKPSMTAPGDTQPRPDSLPGNGRTIGGIKIEADNRLAGTGVVGVMVNPTTGRILSILKQTPDGWTVSTPTTALYWRE